MKTVPFYPNREAVSHHAVPIYQMLFAYYLNKPFEADEMARFMGFAGGKAAWPVKILMHLKRQGFDISLVESFDYTAYEQEGDAYLKQRFEPALLAQLREHTAIDDLGEMLPDFIRSLQPLNRTPTLNDVDRLLKEGKLVAVTADASAFGTAASSEVVVTGEQQRSLLILQREGDDYIAHDPGAPPKPYHRIARNMLRRALEAGVAPEQQSGANVRTADGQGETGADRRSVKAHCPVSVIGFILHKAHLNHRLDQYVVSQFPELSRSYAGKLIDTGKVLVNGKQVKTGYKLHADDAVTIDYDANSPSTVPDIELPVLYEDADCIVINKPAGILTHAQAKHGQEATVASFLRSRISSTGLEGERAGIVHRLDRATSGVIICAKTAPALSWFQKQFADRSVQKTYLAVVGGMPSPKEAVINMPIERNPKAPATFRVGTNGKPAVTCYEVVGSTGGHSLVRLQPKTGRTHQLRVHLQKLGHPIIGDPLYGSGRYGDRLYLHAERLTIVLPGGKTKTFVAPVPDAFRAIMNP